MLIEDARICESLRRIVARWTSDLGLQEDLMQECLIRLWRVERQKPRRTRSWYLQNCRFHLQHYLAAGRSVDSLKRAGAGIPITADGDDENPLVDLYHNTNGEFVEWVSYRDTLSTLSRHLKPRESAVLSGLAQGHVLRDIAVGLKLSYPTALKCRRRIAALTVKLGISPPRSAKARGSRGRTKFSPLGGGVARRAKN